MANKPLSQNDQIRQLFNSLLYVLTNSYYMGKDAHLVNDAKEFVKIMKTDFEAKIEADAKAAVEAANKPKEAVVTVESNVPAIPVQ